MAGFVRSGIPSLCHYMFRCNLLLSQQQISTVQLVLEELFMHYLRERAEGDVDLDITLSYAEDKGGLAIDLACPGKPFDLSGTDEEKWPHLVGPLGGTFKVDWFSGYAAFRGARQRGRPLWRKAGPIYRHRLLSVKNERRPTVVIEVKPAGQGLPQLPTRLEFSQVYELVLDRAPPPLDEHIVHPPALVVHGNAHAGVP